MFQRKKTSKAEPSGQMPGWIRFICIIQLCLAFTLLILFGGYPLLEGYSVTQDRKVHLQLLINDPLYASLPVEQKSELQHAYAKVNDIQNSSYLSRFTRADPLLLGWILLAIILPILALKEKPGIQWTVWTLPLLTAAWIFHNQMRGDDPVRHDESVFFPSEKLVFERYLGEKPAARWEQQMEQVTRGWSLYLKEEWGSEYAFELHKALALTRAEPLDRLNDRRPLPIALLYSIWNTLFACLVTWSLRPLSSKQIIN